MIVCGKEYRTYDEATSELLGVSKNTVYRFWKRNGYEKKTLLEMVQYCVENRLTGDDLKDKKHHDNFKISFEEEMINRFGVENYHKMFLKEENSIDPRHVGANSHLKVNIHCLCNPPHYIQNIEILKIFKYKKCPYVTHSNGNRYLIEEDSLASIYPIVNRIWSEKNDNSPNEIYPSNGNTYYWKCENGFHEDYSRKLPSQVAILKKRSSNICPTCSRLFGGHFENLTGKKFHELFVLGLNKKATLQHNAEAKSRSSASCKMWDCQCSCGAVVVKNGTYLKSGAIKNCGNKKIHYGKELNPNWKGGITTEHEQIRKSPEYDAWRAAVYKKDDYTCQACRIRKQSDNIILHAHHIISFSSLLDCAKENLFDIRLGITLCESCHFSSKEDSLHNVYGTDDVTPEQLEEYINRKWKDLGINYHFSVYDYMDGINVAPPRKTNPKRSRRSDESETSLCKKHGISRATYRARRQKGMSEEEALGIEVKNTKKECFDHLGVRYESIAEMCRTWNVSRAVFDSRQKLGWEISDILTTPVEKKDTTVIDYLGNIYPSINQMCKVYKVNRATYMQRMNAGWTQQEALTGERKRVPHIVDFAGNKFYSEQEMCKKYNVSYSTYLKRKKRGLSNRECLGH